MVHGQAFRIMKSLKIGELWSPMPEGGELRSPMPEGGELTI
jgi:hypothetical protein